MIKYYCDLCGNEMDTNYMNDETTMYIPESLNGKNVHLYFTIGVKSQDLNYMCYSCFRAALILFSCCLKSDNLDRTSFRVEKSCG